MKRIIILIPVFNDWESLKSLISDIEKNIKEIKDFLFDCYIINDASTTGISSKIKVEKIRSLKILNMKKNKGHARCNAFGIRYINQNEKFDYLVLMDGDGEDRAIEIKSFVNKIQSDPDTSVVAKRVKRSEGLFFKFLYQMHKLITLLFTGKNINFGNYSCLTKKDVDIISSKPSLWSSYSGTVKKFVKNFNEINSTRGLRYFGPSKMSFFKLLIHSFSIVAVFKFQVILRSFIIIFILQFSNFFNQNNENIIYFLLIIFNLVIFLISLRESEKDLINSQNNLSSIDNQ